MDRIAQTRRLDRGVPPLRHPFRVRKEPAPDLTRQLIDRCVQNGLLIGSASIYGNVIRVAPPLVISEDGNRSGHVGRDLGGHGQ